MALDQDSLFIAQEGGLECYNGQALLNFIITVNNSDNTAFGFSGYISAFLNIYQSRNQTLLKSFINQISRNSNNLVLNCSSSDMTFNDNGTYYFELGFIQSGGYTIVLRYGVLTVK